MNEDTPIRKQLLSIPNLMGYFRILLIPVIVWRYVTAETVTDYYIAAVMIGISGITDFLDGFVARRFHMITKVGKALDPIADKLTQGAVFMFPVSLYDCPDGTVCGKRRIYGDYGDHNAPEREDAGWGKMVW